MSILSTLTHEFGHRLGFEHNLLGATLAVNERRLPSLVTTATGWGDLFARGSHATGLSARDMFFRAWQEPTGRPPIVVEAPFAIDSVFARYETEEDTMGEDEAIATDLALMLSV